MTKTKLGTEAKGAVLIAAGAPLIACLMLVFHVLEDATSLQGLRANGALSMQQSHQLAASATTVVRHHNIH